MKTRLLQCTACALIALMSSCTADEVVQNDSQGVVMTAQDFIYDSASRTDFVITPQGAQFQWAEKDTVGIFPDYGDQAYFPMISGAGSDKATFNGGGWALKPEHTYTAYYPYIRDIELKRSNIPVSYEGQTQTNNNSTAHLGKYDFMAAVATTPTEGAANFNFQHLGCLVELSITSPNPDEFQYLRIFSNENLFIKKGYVDLTSPSQDIVATEMTNSLQINLINVKTTQPNETFKVYFMIPPFNATNKKIQLEIFNKAAHNQQIALTSKEFKKGFAYQLSATLSDKTSDISFCNVEKAGTLRSIIGEENKTKISKLKLIGELNGDDIKFIREMNGDVPPYYEIGSQITYLDLSEVQIVDGGIDLQTTKDEIGERMFSGFQGMKTIKLPNTLTSVGIEAFHCSGLTNISFPKSVTNVGDYAFEGCKFDSICVPNGIQFGRSVFACDNLVKVTFEEGANTWPEMFNRCINLRTIDLNQSYVDFSTFYKSGLTEVTMPNVTHIYESAFSESLLTIVTMPNVTHIYRGAFDNCLLTNITLPSCIEEIAEFSFFSCRQLSQIYCKATEPPLLDSTAFEGINPDYKIYVPQDSVDKYKIAEGWNNHASHIYAMP